MLKLRILGCCRFSKFPDTPQGVTLIGDSSGTTLCVGPLSGIKRFHSSSYSGTSSKGCYNVVGMPGVLHGEHRIWKWTIVEHHDLWKLTAGLPWFHQRWVERKRIPSTRGRDTVQAIWEQITYRVNHLSMMNVSMHVLPTINYLQYR